MRVKPAAPLLSNTVAKAISFCGEKKYIDSFNWKEASNCVMFNLILSFYYYTLFNNYILTCIELMYKPQNAMYILS